jgi:small subunit ribosomal protein S21
LRRFKKLLERSGLTKELRKRKYYEKPCEARRRAKLRKQSAIRKGLLKASGESRR